MALSAPHDILSSLDADQRRAAEIVEGPLLIVAGPGSGKTRTLTYRLAYLIADRGVPPARCLAVTFTRRAAAEMRKRLAHLAPSSAGAPAIHTFHSLGLAILREHPEAAGLRRDFSVASDDERLAALAETMDISTTKAERLLRKISRAKRGQVAPDGVLAAYDRMLAGRNWIDFDDLVGLAVRALSEANLAARYRAQFSYVSVDEFQDIDEQQYRLITLLAPPPAANLCVIGDPDQAIYGFRGADASCFERFRSDYPTAAQVTLRRNYRSSGTIVTAAAQMIGDQANGDGDDIARMVRAMHERIAVHAAPTERAEAEFVVQTIERLLGGHNFFSIDSGRADGASTGLSFADFAVLYRTDAQSAALVEALARSGIPFRKNGQDALDAEDRVAIDVGPDEDRGDHVALLTLHAAKGLEFRVVFIVGLEDGLLPLHWGDPTEADMAEERRLFYVGMTRAKDRLILSRALKRFRRGRVRTPEPSPFLAAIERELLKHQEVKLPRRKPEDRQLTLL